MQEKIPLEAILKFQIGDVVEVTDGDYKGLIGVVISFDYWDGDPENGLYFVYTIKNEETLYAATINERFLKKVEDKKNGQHYL